LGIAGLSLAMAGGASASTAGPAVDVPLQNGGGFMCAATTGTELTSAARN
jgi:hypothetical protein